MVLRFDPAGQADHQSNHSQASVGLAVVAYRNLSKLLPERLLIKQE